MTRCGIPDVNDQFQFDSRNGTATTLPWMQNWNPGDPPAGKFGNSGFTGYQRTSKGNGFIADKVHVGGAGGFLSLDATAGTNQGNVNTQDNALQIGFDARQTTRTTTRIADPLSGLAVEPGKSGGIFFGLNQDNYSYSSARCSCRWCGGRRRGEEHGSTELTDRGISMSESVDPVDPSSQSYHDPRTTYSFEHYNRLIQTPQRFYLHELELALRSGAPCSRRDHRRLLFSLEQWLRLLHSS